MYRYMPLSLSIYVYMCVCARACNESYQKGRLSLVHALADFGVLASAVSQMRHLLYQVHEPGSNLIKRDEKGPYVRATRLYIYISGVLSLAHLTFDYSPNRSYTALLYSCYITPKYRCRPSKDFPEGAGGETCHRAPCYPRPYTTQPQIRTS